MLQNKPNLNGNVGQEYENLPHPFTTSQADPPTTLVQIQADDKQYTQYSQVDIKTTKTKKKPNSNMAPTTYETVEFNTPKEDNDSD